MSDIYLFQVASQKSQWLSARQTAVASNVANASTPGYRAVDVQPFSAVLDTPRRSPWPRPTPAI